MITWGINALNHGSSLSVFNNSELMFTEAHASDELDAQTLRQAFDYGGPSEIYWYERPYIKKLRQLRAGQWNRAFAIDDIPSRYLKSVGVGWAKVKYTPHHASHAAAGYYTSSFNHCAVVVLDAIGEFECASIWEGKHGELRKVWSKSYPHSLGLFYSAFTHLIGLTPVQDEYILQQMARQGDPNRYYHRICKYFNGPVELAQNLHKGVVDWEDEIDNVQTQQDIAAAVQQVFQENVNSVMLTAQHLTGSNSLVYMGGCAMNSDANKACVEPHFDYIWSLPQPGDPSSSIGAVLYHTKQRTESKQLGVVKHITINV